MNFDYKKEYKALYQPSKTPALIQVPAIKYLAIRGAGDPNGAVFQDAIAQLYAVSYTIKMNGKEIPGYFPYVVPPLEGLWWQPGQAQINCCHKDEFHWIAMIRLPEFVTRDVYDWAIQTAQAKKHRDFSPVEFHPYEEGICIQCMHLGSYDNEPATISALSGCATQLGYTPDLSRFHHEIYLSDPRKTASEKLRTVIRIPIKKLP